MNIGVLSLMTMVKGSIRLPGLGLAACLGLALSGCAASAPQPADDGIVAFPGAAPAPAQNSAALTLETPVERIAADPAGAAILNKDIPGLLSDSNYPMFKGMNLKTLASLSGGRLDDATLAQTKADLDALPKEEASLK
jgi:hypothetical protein